MVWYRSGLVLMALAVLIFSFMAALAKFAAATVPSAEVVFFRSAINGLLILCIHYCRKKRGPLLGNNRKLLVLRGVLGAVGINLWFFALSEIPVAEATLLWLVAPVFVLPIAWLWLKETVTRLQVLMIPVVLAGVVLVLKPGFDMINLGGLAALGCALFSAGSHVTIRRLADEDAHTIVLYFSVFATVSAAPLMLPGFVWPTGLVLLALLTIGVLSVAAQMLMTLAYHYDSAGRVVMITYTGVVFAGVWDFVFFAHLPGWMTVAGAVLIVGALLGLRRGVGLRH
ncbi:DMT family transporter [Myxococcota bacterium]